MNAIMKQMLELALRAALGLIGEMILAFIDNLRASRADDPELASVIESIVRGIDADNPDAPGEQKFEWAYAALNTYLSNVGRDLKTSLKNSLIEMAVQKVRAGTGG